MSERTRAGALRVVVFGGLAIGAVVALPVAIVTAVVADQRCTPDEECLSIVAGLGAGVLGGAVALVIATILLALRLRLGVMIGIGLALGSVLFLGAALAALWTELMEPFVFLAALGFAVAMVVIRGRQPTADGRSWTRPSLGVVLVAVGVVALGALPTLLKLNSVSSEQKRIEAVIARPLLSDEHWPFAVRPRDAGFEYDVLEPEPDGSKIARFTVTLRNLPPGQAPCGGFTDWSGGPVRVTGCTKVGPNLWRGTDSRGETRYFVHDGDRQWAHVRTEPSGGADARRERDARAGQFARSLRPHSAFPLAADTAGCRFCEWLPR
ncbi:hypothetical protein [Kribbella solani]|uniref:Uncharacterized protein n=1 Tax=Kribbella solani TaxID=236067 RepID=A0A841DNK1_9ACTN|nr:hypothetical protein [Kribbella solani]MBB5980243.1 hypothetical protein [Kribbella solani]